MSDETTDRVDQVELDMHVLRDVSERLAALWAQSATPSDLDRVKELTLKLTVAMPNPLYDHASMIVMFKAIHYLAEAMVKEFPDARKKFGL